MKRLFLIFLIIIIMLFPACLGTESNEKGTDDNVFVSSVEKDNDIEPKSNGKYTVGEHITFGSYEQDNDHSNGTEEIEWIIIDLESDRIFVLSKYALDLVPYNYQRTDVNWETCSLRQWLNNDFFEKAFSVEEKAKIPTVTVMTEKNPEYGTDSGNDTQDKVFTLSLEDGEQYFNESSQAKCKATNYAIACGVYVESEGNWNAGNCAWWLRNSGKHHYSASCYYPDGYARPSGDFVNNDLNAVRPAMWIEID